MSLFTKVHSPLTRKEKLFIILYIFFHIFVAVSILLVGAAKYLGSYTNRESITLLDILFYIFIVPPGLVAALRPGSLAKSD